MEPNTDLIYSERFNDLWPAFRHIASNLSREPGGGHSFDVSLSGEEVRPLVRALNRAEAQLLIEDAEALVDPAVTDRTPGERRYDAFMLVVAGIGTCLGTGADHSSGAGSSRRLRRDGQRRG